MCSTTATALGSERQAWAYNCCWTAEGGRRAAVGLWHPWPRHSNFRGDLVQLLRMAAPAGEAGVQSFGNIFLGQRGGVVRLAGLCMRQGSRWLSSACHHHLTCLCLLLLQSQGQLKLAPAGISWKKAGGGKAVDIKKTGVRLSRGSGRPLPDTEASVQ